MGRTALVTGGASGIGLCERGALELLSAAGKIFTLSPWPIETYWAWTRAVDSAEYVLT
jgi:hypothetical protein